MTKKDNFKHIYEQSKDKIYRLCLGFTGNTMDCDDLFQEVYIKVWNNLESFRNESNVNTWIYRIATNAAIAFVANRTKHTKRNSDLDPNTKLSYPEKRFYSDEKIAKLYQAISTLKEKDRLLIGLVLDENSYAEISKIMGFTISNVGVRINRIKKRLTKKMKSNG